MNNTEKNRQMTNNFKVPFCRYYLEKKSLLKLVLGNKFNFQ